MEKPHRITDPARIAVMLEAEQPDRVEMDEHQVVYHYGVDMIVEDRRTTRCAYLTWYP